VTIVSRALARPLTIGRQLDRRLLLGVVGALVILVSYLLPMYPERIGSARTRFSKGTMIESHFSVLVSGQHYRQEHRPLDEEFESVTIRVAPVPYPASSGLGWLAAVATRRTTLGQHASFALAMALPLVSALAMVAYAAATRGEPARRTHPIPALIHLAVAAPLALVLAWLHQFDFSAHLLELGEGALMPAPAFWVALGGTVVVAASALSLRRETL